jgi:hypothetical protein
MHLKTLKLKEDSHEQKIQTGEKSGTQKTPGS